MTSEELVDLAESILSTLRRDYPDFSFSETIAAYEIDMEMRNTAGLDLKYSDAICYLGLILKEKKTANLFDGFISCDGRQFDLDKFWDITHQVLEAYRTPVALPPGDTLPIISFDTSGTLDFLRKSLNGERYATGSSLFSGKMEQQLFNEKITVEINRNPLSWPKPFFDMEGVVLKDDRYPLIAAGKLVGVFTDKKIAAQYNLPHTGAAGGEYDDMPGIDASRSTPLPLRFKSDSTDLKSALKGQPAILVIASSGGDFTPDGSFAAPVQVSLLFDGEKVVGKLPEFTMRSHLYKMMGEDYIGTFDNDILYLGDLPTQLQCCCMTIVR
jgi:PmbA protein